VDCYTGGIEPPRLHLIYTRFFNKALRDIGLFPHDEPDAATAQPRASSWAKTARKCPKSQAT